VLPIGGDRHDGTAIATYTLMALMGGVFAAQLFLGRGSAAIPLSFAFIPGQLLGELGAAGGAPVIPPPATLVSYMFLHGGWLHLLSNLLFLWVFGPRVEHTLGPGPYTVVFVLCGIGAALAQGWSDPSSATPLVGASGGVSGVLGAHLLLHPRAEVHVLTPVVVYMDVVELPAFVVILAWFGLQLLYARWVPAGYVGIAFIAHVGGFLTGVLLAPLVAPRACLAGWRAAPRRASVPDANLL
jgi:membrane associated rhomboid family serine protease